jgi:hypothetical protein
MALKSEWAVKPLIQLDTHSDIQFINWSIGPLVTKIKSKGWGAYANPRLKPLENEHSFMKLIHYARSNMIVTGKMKWNEVLFKHQNSFTSWLIN